MSRNNDANMMMRRVIDGGDDDNDGGGDDDDNHVENTQDPDGIPSRVPIWPVPPPRLPLPKVRMVCHELRTTIATCCLQPLGSQ